MRGKRERMQVSSRWIETGAVIVGSLFLGFLFSHSILPHLGRITLAYDWTRGLEWAWSNWITISRFHQFPLWNPYKCGGLPAFANPQSHLLTPFLPLHFIFGPVAGLELEIPLHAGIAFSGAYVLARILGSGILGAIACSVAFAGSSWLFLHAAVGHEVFFPAAYLPWACVFFWRSFLKRSLADSSIAGLLIALMFWEGGVYVVIQIAVFLTVIACVLSVSERSGWPLLSLLMVALFALGFAAVKLAPSAQMMMARPRPGYTNWVGPYATLLSIISRRQDFFGPMKELGFWEHGAYVSPVFVILGLVGMLRSWRKGFAWIFGAGVFFVLALGGVSRYSPYVLLHGLPFVSSTYAPSRFLISFVLCFAVLVALGADYLSRQSAIARGVAVLLIAIGALDCLIVSPGALKETFSTIPPRGIPESAEFRQFRDSSPSNIGMLPLNLANLGAVNCWETNFLNYSNPDVAGFNEARYRGEQYLVGPGDVRLIDWSPNALTYEVNAPSPTVLVVNQSYDAGWRIVDGEGVVSPHHHLLSVSVPATKGKVKLVYRPTSFIVGLIVMLVTCLGFVWLLVAARRSGSEAR